ncbi:MAG: 30S ribosomal protein S5 [Patescibacteria group bacterium]|nr:30S ribosomal protein S5 [Patescibacteria group bacterium]
MEERNQKEQKEFEEKVLEIRRVSKKTEGGNRFRFTALVVVGDRKGRVGMALGKAPGVRPAIDKATSKAKKNLQKVVLENGTIPFEIRVKEGAADILLRPAPAGTGISLGGAARTIAELAGIQDITGKILGTRNKYSNALAMFKALERIRELSRKYETK